MSLFQFKRRRARRPRSVVLTLRSLRTRRRRAKFLSGLDFDLTRGQGTVRSERLRGLREYNRRIRHAFDAAGIVMTHK